MAKQIIRLTEGDLHRIIENTVKKIIREGKYGDWRDDYEEWINSIQDKEEGARLNNKWHDSLKQQFNGDKRAMRNALNGHFKEKDAAREKRLSKEDPKFLDWENAWDKKYDLENNINVGNDESFDDFDFDAEQAKQAAKRERKMASRKSPKKKESEMDVIDDTPSIFKGKSADELEKLGASMGYFK